MAASYDDGRELKLIYGAKKAVVTLPTLACPNSSLSHVPPDHVELLPTRKNNDNETLADGAAETNQHACTAARWDVPAVLGSIGMVWRQSHVRIHQLNTVHRPP